MTPHRVLGAIAGPLVFAGILLAGLEIGLRAAPGRLIPLSLLKKFQPDLRLEIADRQLIPNRSMMWELERDDGGPPLKLYKPHARVALDFSKQQKHGVLERDAQGFCNPEGDDYDREKIELLAIGDSFTTCTAVSPDVSWSSEIGRRTGLSVYNLGRGGVGPFEYLQILKRFGLQKDPDFVVMNVYEGNDLRDVRRYHEHVEAAKRGIELYEDAADRDEEELDYATLYANPLGRRSYAYNFLVAALGKGFGALRNEYERVTGGDAPGRVNFRYELRFPDQSVSMNVQNSDQSEVRSARALRAGEIDLSLFDAALTGFVALAHERGFVPVVAYSPSAYTAYDGYVAFEDPELAELMPWFSRSQREYFRRRTDEIGYVFVDLTPTLQETARELGGSELLYSPFNVHYTAEGHRVAGAELARAIQELRAPTEIAGAHGPSAR